ncbi:aldehyde dehydrogenase family protein [Rubellimicrobium sp. CFH 75288]|uniref:aldehyde dehydrogenase family protein n=1 Tax=Rubellimicrobium sp. CFH 75288 TaxID=2697034 RepID=UPI001413603A|nr:aldehyde dehydrogenase family protein [Rubellimicrobium sp. CFH 75288]NAZ37529.1 aldehyde dehydrogenase family protein [Rubellimicrobium sp. CFH 75288]
MIDKRGHYIGGAWVESRDGQEHVVIDPSTEEEAVRITLAGPQDVEAAVAAAREALPAWSDTDPAERRALVERILDQYKRRERDLAEAISREMGAPIDFALAEQAAAFPYHTKAFLRAFDTLEWMRPADGGRTKGAMLAWEPIGVVALITPWNWPANQIALKVIPALLAGCTMVLKPSEQAPLSACVVAEMIDAAGCPPGVFNMIQGDGAGAGARLSSHPDIQMVSFTGSTRAGRAITVAAADTFKRVTLELGGKGANLVFADADEEAVERGVRHMMENAGQSCNAPSRMLVERPVYERAVEQARALAEETRVGPASEPGDHIGPVVNARQWEHVQGLIQKGIEEGARLVAGGPGRPEHLNRGFFVRPTVFADVEPGQSIERIEIFGPVLSMIPFDTEDEALRIANDTDYGLTNYVQTADEERRRRLARRLRAGMIEMNGQSRGEGAPFGGTKASGRAREGGIWGIEEFLELKSISGW